MAWNPTLTQEVNVTAASFTADYRGMINCDCTSNAITVTLPDVTQDTGAIYIIKKSDSTSNAVTVATTSSQTIDGKTTFTLEAQFEQITVFSDGSKWELISNYSVGIRNQHFAINDSGITQWNFGRDGVQALAASGTYTLSNASSSNINLSPTTGNQTLILPAASTCSGKLFFFSKIAGSFFIIVQTNGTDTLGSSGTSFTSDSSNPQSIQVLSDGVSRWLLFNQPKTSATASNWVQYVDPFGVQKLSQPAFSDLSGTTTVKTKDLGILINGNGSVPTTGVLGEMTVDFACTIQSVTIIADQTGSATFDILKSTYAGYSGSLASIVASAPPTLSSANKSQDTTLTGWTTSIAAGDVLRFTLSTISTCTRLSIILKVSI